ncbi:MAG: DUF4317 domain-containing protein [Clostridia bacterium]|nr:DUF4317 domain-containing protein [Clostridia bacterium]
MTDRELRELKRRFRPDKSNISTVVGCYINENKEVVYKINQSLSLGDSVVSEQLLAVLRRSLSGSIGISQNQIEFSTKDVSESPKHALLMKLRASGLRDEDALGELYTAIAESLELDSSYVVLLASDVYDVKTRHSDGEDGESTSQFSYFTCAICPVKEAPNALRFREADRLFHSDSAQGILSNPEIGFMFPAFDDRSSNIYGALYYTRSKSTSYSALTERIFGVPHPMPPVVQRTAFSETLGNALADECTLDVVKAVHSAIGEIVEAHKESKDPEPLTVTKHNVKEMLQSIGVEEESIKKVGTAMDEIFGNGAALTPKNIVQYNKFELKMPEIKVTVSPEYKELVTTRVIGGEKYLMIKVSGPIEVNGIPVSIDEDN